MESDGPVHRLAAIISGDIVGYSRLIGTDEAAAVRLVTAYREEIELLVRQNRGELVDFTGDNFLAHFSSSLAAVSCAVEIQQVLRARNQSLPEDRRMRFRLGIHQGDVRMEGGRVFGTGVNIAARLEALADPGGICISGSIKDQLQGRMDLRTDDMGSKSVKNISEPVRVHRLIFGDAAASAASPATTASGPSYKVLAAAAVLVLLVAIGLGFWLSQGAGDSASPSVAANSPASVRTLPSGRDDAARRSTANSNLEDRPSIVVLPFTNMSGDA